LRAERRRRNEVQFELSRWLAALRRPSSRRKRREFREPSQTSQTSQTPPPESVERRRAAVDADRELTEVGDARNIRRKITRAIPCRRR
ncbi:MAG: hypothetical protein IJE97_12760, partial [Thermoguttaceae bacterium]|nr:hypothetical protein [Thermoguttaceae bacterium]